jgi:hypothetical protein
LTLYREEAFSDDEINSLPPRLFGSATQFQEFVAEPDTIALSQLLGNDTGNGIRFDSFEQPQHGTLEAVFANGTTTIAALRYIRRPNFVPPNGDQFYYKIIDSAGQKAIGLVTVIENVTPE